MYATADLEEGIAWATRTFDAAPAYGGEHVGLGTRAAFLSLGDTYLEIIGPDPDQNLRDTFGGLLNNLQQGGLITWIARGPMGPIASTVEAHDMSVAGPKRTQRKLNNGDLLEWDLLFARAHPFGARMPFFIDWLQSPHPAQHNPIGGQYKALTLTTPEPDALRTLLLALDLNIEVNPGEPGIQVTIQCAHGEVTLTSTVETSRITL